MHGLEEGREERKREKKKGAIPEVSEKGPKNQTSTPKFVEKGCQNRPTSCQSRPRRFSKLRQESQKIQKNLILYFIGFCCNVIVPKNNKDLTSFYALDRKNT